MVWLKVGIAWRLIATAPHLVWPADRAIWAEIENTGSLGLTNVWNASYRTSEIKLAK